MSDDMVDVRLYRPESEPVKAPLPGSTPLPSGTSEVLPDTMSPADQFIMATGGPNKGMECAECLVWTSIIGSVFCCMPCVSIFYCLTGNCGRIKEVWTQNLII